MTLRDWLALARSRGADRLDAQLLLGSALERPRSWLLAHDDAALDAAQLQWLDSALQRRLDGEPLAYLVGEKEFHGLVLDVDARVLVPRPDTEVLVNWALELLGRTDSPARVVDLGTGSGAIALALRHRRPDAQVWGTDISEGALEVARRNASRLSLRVQWLLGPWWDAVGALRFDVALSNPPYVASGDSHLPALRHEPYGALVPGSTGLEAFEAIVRGAGHHLQPGGWLLLEHGFDQAAAVRHLLLDAGFALVMTRSDLAGQPRCSGGRLGAVQS